jgi:hypothetical protein
LRWQPIDFWKSNVWEFANAIEGLSQAKGGNKNKTPTKDDMKLVLETEKRLQRKHGKRNSRISSQD